MNKTHLETFRGLINQFDLDLNYNMKLSSLDKVLEDSMSFLSSLYENNNVILVYRNQWANYNPNNLAISSDSPNTGILSLNLKSRDKNLSFGMNVISDNLGPIEFFNFSPYFSLRKKINNSFFSVSVSPSFKSTTLNFSSLIFVNPSDPFNIGGKQTQSEPDINFGFSYYNERVLLSLSAKNLAQPSFNFGLSYRF